MSGNQDLSHVLEGWAYKAGQVTARLVPGWEGREKLQLRLDLGILQMELEGRPDGERPEGYASQLEYCREMVEALQAAGREWKLEGGDLGKLQQEALQLYHRYLALFHLGDWGRVVRDTGWALEILDLVEEHAAEPVAAWPILQHRPYVVMMRARAQGNLALEEGDYEGARACIDQAVEEIKRFFVVNLQAGAFEQSQEARYLQNWRSELAAGRRVAPRAMLERALAAAISREEYERAAQLRDRLKALGGNAGTPLEMTGAA